MFALIRSLRANKRLLRDLVVRDLRARYVGSSMGFFWSVLFPIVNLFVYMFVFRLVLRVRWDDQAGVGETAIAMLAGILIWAAFAETVSRTTNVLVENANLIQKVVFPSEVLPVFLTVSSIVNMLIGLPIALAGVLWFGYLKGADTEVAVLDAPAPAAVEAQHEEDPAAPEQGELPPIRKAEMELKEPYPVQEGHKHTFAFGAPLLLLPLLLVLQAVFTLGLGLGLFFSALNLLLRDTFHLIGVLITVWMFATPIFYPAGLVAATDYAWVLDLNPMYWLIDSYRAVLLYAEWPDWSLLARFAVVSVAVFAAGSAFFMAQKGRFPDLL